MAAGVAANFFEALEEVEAGPVVAEVVQLQGAWFPEVAQGSGLAQCGLVGEGDEGVLDVLCHHGTEGLGGEALGGLEVGHQVLVEALEGVGGAGVDAAQELDRGEAAGRDRADLGDELHLRSGGQDDQAVRMPNSSTRSCSGSKGSGKKAAIVRSLVIARQSGSVVLMTK